jgi:hypothetical protein
MIEVVELLVDVFGEECKKNQYEVLSQRSLRTQEKGDRFKIQDSPRGYEGLDSGSGSGMTENVSPRAAKLKEKKYS